MSEANERGSEALGWVEGVDRLVPANLLARGETRLRARVLVVSSLGIGALVSIVQVIRAVTMPRDVNFWAGVVILACVLGLPLVQWFSRSVRVAGGLLSVLLIAAFPGLIANFGSFPAPAIVMFPVVPVLVTFFSGVSLGLVSALVLGASVFLVAEALPGVDVAMLVRSRPTTVAYSTIAPLISFLLAAVYERNRQRSEAELRRINDELVAAQARAEVADRRKTEFLWQMSHELRTPLNAIIGYGELLAEEVGERGEHPEMAADAARICAAGRHLLGLINDLLDISKIGSGTIEVHYDRFSVAEVLGEIGDVLGPLASRRHNALVIEVSPAVEAIECDRQRLHQILLNLGGNACKFTEGGTLRIGARASEGGERVVFEVSDTGVGMTAGELDRIFEPFVQVGEESARREGSGLGLVITKQLVERLGGTIRVASAPGVGSTFTFDLPVRRPSPAGA